MIELPILPLPHHLELIDRTLVDYYADDIWDAFKNPKFEQNKGKTRENRYLIFESFTNTYIKNEIKMLAYHRINYENISLFSIWRYRTPIIILGEFISLNYPYIKSILEIPKEKFLFKYRNYLESRNLPIIIQKKPDLGRRNRDTTIHSNPSYYIMFVNLLYDFLNNFYDDRDEVEKDRWDVRRLPIENNPTTSNYYLDFSSTPVAFKELLKRYIKEVLVVQKKITWSTAASYIGKLPLFFTFIHDKYPAWIDLIKLSREDIVQFIAYLRKTPMGGRQPNQTKEPSENHISFTLINLETFIDHIQRYEWPEAPDKPMNTLIFREDKPHRSPTNPNEIKYIPDHIWDTVVEHIEHVPSQYVPIILLLEATGFRVTDVLSLKANCLVYKDGWWIVGNQRKVKYKDHRVPITEEIAKIVKTQQEFLKIHANSENNPKNFIFPKLFGKRMGFPIGQAMIAHHLNKLFCKFDIRDENGEIYWFTAHAFRHRYGVNLINNGMNIVHVQKLMAHASPEMTLIYAKILDTTLRREWEKARENGAVRLDSVGNIIPADIKQQALENGLELEWIRHNLDSIRLDHGFCVKSPKLKCDFLEQTLEPPCIKNNCRSFHVDLTFLSFYEDQIGKMESDILVYEKSGRTRSIEVIEPKLKRYREIAESLRANKSIAGISKDKREYINEERKEVKNG